MNMGVLSQDEIDALLHKGKSDKNGLKSKINSMKCVTPDISRAISLVMTVLFNKPVKVSGGVYASTIQGDMLDQSKEIYLACEISSVKSRGNLIFACSKESAGILSDLLMGGKGSYDEVDSEQRRVKPLSDLFNQVAIAVAQELSRNNLVEFEPYGTNECHFGALKKDWEKYFSTSREDQGASIEFTASIGQSKSPSFILFFTQQFMSNMSGKLKDGNDGESKDNDKVDKKESVMVRPVKFGEFEKHHEISGEDDLSIIMGLPLELSVELGRTKMKIKDVLSLRKGSVIELNKLAGEAVDIMANGKLIASGEVIVLNENFGVRINSIIEDSIIDK